LVKHRQEGVRNVLWCRVARPGNESVPPTIDGCHDQQGESSGGSR
jgi:hypothetical protein